jgi:hypothetical protein
MWFTARRAAGRSWRGSGEPPPLLRTYAAPLPVIASQRACRYNHFDHLGYRLFRLHVSIIGRVSRQGTDAPECFRSAALGMRRTIAPLLGRPSAFSLRQPSTSAQAQARHSQPTSAPKATINIITGATRWSKTHLLDALTRL